MSNPDLNLDEDPRDDVFCEERSDSGRESEKSSGRRTVKLYSDDRNSFDVRRMSLCEEEEEEERGGCFERGAKWGGGIGQQQNRRDVTSSPSALFLLPCSGEREERERRRERGETTADYVTQDVLHVAQLLEGNRPRTTIHLHR